MRQGFFYLFCFFDNWTIFKKDRQCVVGSRDLIVPFQSFLCQFYALFANWECTISNQQTLFGGRQCSALKLFNKIFNDFQILYVNLGAVHKLRTTDMEEGSVKKLEKIVDFFYGLLSNSTVGFQSIEIAKKVFLTFVNVFHVYLMRGFQKYERN